MHFFKYRLGWKVGSMLGPRPLGNHYLHMIVVERQLDVLMVSGPGRLIVIGNG